MCRKNIEKELLKSGSKNESNRNVMARCLINQLLWYDIVPDLRIFNHYFTPGIAGQSDKSSCNWRLDGESKLIATISTSFRSRSEMMRPR